MRDQWWQETSNQADKEEEIQYLPVMAREDQFAYLAARNSDVNDIHLEIDYKCAECGQQLSFYQNKITQDLRCASCAGLKE